MIKDALQDVATKGDLRGMEQNITENVSRNVTAQLLDELFKRYDLTRKHDEEVCQRQKREQNLSIVDSKKGGRTTSKATSEGGVSTNVGETMRRCLSVAPCFLKMCTVLLKRWQRKGRALT